MIPGLLQRPRFLAALNKAIRWAQPASFSRILLARPPIVAAPDIAVSLQRGRPLRETGYAPRKQPHFFLHEWPRYHLHSIRFPYLACLLEGEMDWRIGITQEMAKSLPPKYGHCNGLTLSFQAGQFFLMPPGTPYATGKRLHWHRPHPEDAHYKILWMHFLPTGVFCHLSDVNHGETTSSSPLYVHDARAHLQSEFLIEELQERDDDCALIARDQLHSILLRIRRQLTRQQPFPISGSSQAWRHESAQQDIRVLAADSATAVQRACDYIETHLHEALQQQLIARQALVSPSHLNRLFVRELGLPIMRYVAKRRLEIAQALLTHSALPVREIGRQVGYANPSHFAQFFNREAQKSPQAFRHFQRKSKT
jgi:AraC-like DNA-binding protein